MYTFRGVVSLSIWHFLQRLKNRSKTGEVSVRSDFESSQTAFVCKRYDVAKLINPLFIQLWNSSRSFVLTYSFMNLISSGCSYRSTVRTIPQRCLALEIGSSSSCSPLPTRYMTTSRVARKMQLATLETLLDAKTHFAYIWFHAFLYFCPFLFLLFLKFPKLFARKGKIHKTLASSWTVWHFTFSLLYFCGLQ